MKSARNWAWITAAALGLTAPAAWAQPTAGAKPPADIPMFSNQHIARQAFFHVGGQYVEHEGEHYLQGSMYVEVWEPATIRQPYPIVFMHGTGQTGMYWRQTPDGRPGWAYYLVEQGYVVYMVDYPARGRSIYVPGVDEPLDIRSAERICCDEVAAYTHGIDHGRWPRADRLSQWPGSDQHMGDPVFDAFYKTQVEYTAGPSEIIRDAMVALLDRIGHPVVLIAHSQGGGIVWAVADARPALVTGIVGLEPSGPPMQAVNRQTVEGRERRNWGPSSLPLAYDPPISSPADFQLVREPERDAPDMVQCYLQQEPAHRLANLADIPAMIVVGAASYHYVYDHCTAKWLNQAGMQTDYVPLDSRGILGNAHEMMIEKNSDEIIRVIDGWIQDKVN
jgi:pimeloyl-ACP methyl ester carboxylesterase